MVDYYEALLHSYRALIRKSGYLADPNARSYVFAYVKDRFRSRDCLRKRNVLCQRQALANARKGVSILDRAITGDPTALKKVLAHTYGRAGKRRRELLSQVQKADASAALRASSNLSNDGPKVASGLREVQTRPRYLPQLPPVRGSQLESLLHSHMKHRGLDVRRGSVRSLAPKIPELNIWGRPMPMCRQRNMVKKWLAQTLDSVMPPLPPDEWERLRDLASGSLGIPKAPPRRVRPVEPNTSFDSDVLSFLSRPSWLIDGKNELVYCKTTGQLSITPGEPPVPRRMSSRSHRRIYAGLWSHTPRIDYDEGQKKWQITWGGYISALPRKLPAASSHGPEYFTLPANGLVRAARSKRGRGGKGIIDGASEVKR